MDVDGLGETAVHMDNCHHGKRNFPHFRTRWIEVSWLRNARSWVEVQVVIWWRGGRCRSCYWHQFLQVRYREGLCSTYLFCDLSQFSLFKALDASSWCSVTAESPSELEWGLRGMIVFVVSGPAVGATSCSMLAHSRPRNLEVYDGRIAANLRLQV